eukprot:scaffold122748_cov22-Cyclotella_meneghiniana.AAC.2
MRPSGRILWTTTPKAKGEQRDYGLSHTDIEFFLLPAGGVFQTEPPGGCLRQAVEFGTCILSSRGRMIRWIHPLKFCRIHCGYIIQNAARLDLRLSDAAICRGEHADWIPGLSFAFGWIVFMAIVRRSRGYWCCIGHRGNRADWFPSFEFGCFCQHYDYFAYDSQGDGVEQL